MFRVEARRFAEAIERDEGAQHEAYDGLRLKQAANSDRQCGLFPAHFASALAPSRG